LRRCGRFMVIVANSPDRSTRMCSYPMAASSLPSLRWRRPRAHHRPPAPAARPAREPIHPAARGPIPAQPLRLSAPPARPAWPGLVMARAALRSWLPSAA
jgi:hypothetical protein